LLALTQPVWAEPVTVDSVRGEVEFRKADNDSWQALDPGTVLSLPVEVRAGAGSGARIVQDGSSFTLRSETRVTIESPAEDPGGLVERVRQWLGTVLYRVERRPDEFSVETPFLVSTVKGTEFVVVSSQTSSFVTLMEGRLEVEDLGSGERQLMQTGDVIEVNETSQLRSLRTLGEAGSATGDSAPGDSPEPGRIGLDVAEDRARGRMDVDTDDNKGRGRAAFAEQLQNLPEAAQERRERASGKGRRDADARENSQRNRGAEGGEGAEGR